MASQPIAQMVQLPNFRSLPGQDTAKVFRSGALSELSQAGQQELVEHGIECIVDLREPYEIAAAPDLLDEHTYVNIPLYRGQVPLAAAIDDVYRLLIMQRGHQIAAAIQAIAQYLPHRVVVHCKAGKDRTGLVAALVMAAADVATAAIVADYAQSADNLSPQYRSQMTDQLQADLADSPAALETAMHLHLASPGAALQRALELVDTKFGSARAYLSKYGVTDAQLATLADHFVTGSPAS